MKKYDVAAYIWPAYTGDELRSRIFWSDGIGEWQTVKLAGPKFEGHTWPRKPLWGYVNEADPDVMEMQIEEATKHGVNVFIYDWYWYDRRPFLENCLNDGFLKAKNNSKMKFYLMWANHDATHLWQRELSDTECFNVPVWSGAQDRAEFERICERIMDKYFVLDNYYRIDGKPVFMIYEISTFIRGMGSLSGAKDALKWFRARAVEKGLRGVHLQFTGRKAKTINLSGVDGNATVDTLELIKELGFDSFTHYQYAHLTDVDRDYNEINEDIKKIWEDSSESYGIPYFAHVSCGWDNNPRFKKFIPRVVKNNTPENFEKILLAAKDYTDRRQNQPPLVTINSWNEWTETSYLQPDDLYGYGYLDAIKKVFLDQN